MLFGSFIDIFIAANLNKYVNVFGSGRKNVSLTAISITYVLLKKVWRPHGTIQIELIRGSKMPFTWNSFSKAIRCLKSRQAKSIEMSP